MQTKDTKLLSTSILKCLSYYDIFSYPLRADEIYHSIDRNSTTPELVEEVTQALAEKGEIKQVEGFYGFGELRDLVDRRLVGNEMAKHHLPIADKWSKRISGFPYVRGVFLSGSISKNFMEEDGDIDYFIVTEPNRLWISRTILVLYKKLVLLNSHKYFCVNYFVDTEHLEIEEKNQFTAVELVTLIPTRGPKVYEAFRAANDWTNSYFPNFPTRSVEQLKPAKRGFFKKVIEAALNNPLGTVLDRGCMKLTVGFWKRKFTAFEKDRFDIALKSRPYVSKHHPNNYQKKVLDAFHEKIASLS